MQYCEEAGSGDLIDLTTLKEKLLLQVKSSITQNTAEWETYYICKPSQFFNNRDSIFYPDNRDIAEYECGNIIKTQFEDGSWNIPWGWNGYPEEWAISRYIKNQNFQDTFPIVPYLAIGILVKYLCKISIAIN